MAGRIDRNEFTAEALEKEAGELLAMLRDCPDVEGCRYRIAAYATERQHEAATMGNALGFEERTLVRDCARVLRHIVTAHADAVTGCSTAQALHDIAHGVERPDLQAGFFAEVIHLIRGLELRSTPGDHHQPAAELDGLMGREAAARRSDSLDGIGGAAMQAMDRFVDGLDPASVERRRNRRKRILRELGGTPADWKNWKWHVGHIVRDEDELRRVAVVSEDEVEGVRAARGSRVPFGITPYTLSLFDDDPVAGRDLAIRAQVLPPLDYATAMGARKGMRREAFDFMREADTSPVDLVTRRYARIVILKPINTCPQICVYCQRNWEIEQAMAPDAVAPRAKVDEAIDWIAARPSINEVLVTGGDVLALTDVVLHRVLERLAAIPHVDLIRLGTRVPVTLPMRVTKDLAAMLASFRRPGHREICVVTHVEHVYEITPDFVAAIERLRRRGIAVFNQHVYNFFVSRRFETARLRTFLRRCGVEPYYTFVPKGKDEMAAYRVPLARLLQEQKEEARLLPGSRRTDEAVYNVPGLGKNYVRAVQHRDLLGIRPDGSRVYEFHPWEKGVAPSRTWVGDDVPILEYLDRLAALGENPDDYESIWYYF